MTFANLLRNLREDQGISQSSLGLMADYDHSYISKLESETRNPTREAVLNIATALDVDDADRDRLLMLAGFMPVLPTSVLGHEPVIETLYEVLQDDELPYRVRDRLRDQVWDVVHAAMDGTVA